MLAHRHSNSLRRIQDPIKNRESIPPNVSMQDLTLYFHYTSVEAGVAIVTPLNDVLKGSKVRKAWVDGPCASPFAHCVKLRLDYHILSSFYSDPTTYKTGLGLHGTQDRRYH